MKSYFEKKDDTLIVVFHGTGGDELDLVPLVQTLFSKSSILSLRGEVSENGMNRFFKRYAHGSFDEDSIRSEAAKIHSFLESKITEFTRVIFFGYSNGANMIGALLSLYPSFITEAVLLHPMKVIDIPSHINAKVVVTSGKYDQLISEQETQRFISFLQKQGAVVTSFSFESGHEITMDEIQTLSDHFKAEVQE